MLSKYDKNGDGKLDLIVTDMDMHGKSDSAPELKPVYNNKIDYDGDGKADRIIMKDMDGDGKKEQVVESKYDTDHDGKKDLIVVPQQVPEPAP